MESIEARVKKIVADHLGLDDEPPIANGDTFEDLGADSLDAIELIIGCEEDFGIEIPDAEAEELKTVQQLVDYVTARAGTASA